MTQAQRSAIQKKLGTIDEQSSTLAPHKFTTTLTAKTPILNQKHDALMKRIRKGTLLIILALVLLRMKRRYLERLTTKNLPSGADKGPADWKLEQQSARDNTSSSPHRDPVVSVMDKVISIGKVRNTPVSTSNAAVSTNCYVPFAYLFQKECRQLSHPLFPAIYDLLSDMYQ